MTVEKNRGKGTVPFPRDVFARFTMRSLAANRVRTVVTIVGIALATGLLMAVLSSVTSLRQAMLDRESAAGGVWQVGLSDADDATLDRLRDAAGERLDRLSLLSDYGAAALSTEDSEAYGDWLGVISLPDEQDGYPHAAGDDAYEVYPAPRALEGRLPERPGEIALPFYLEGATLSAGEQGAGGTDATRIPGAAVGATSDGALELGGAITLSLGRRVWTEDPSYAIDSGIGLQIDYADPDNAGGTVLETLTDVGEARTYTVVGFVETDYNLGNSAYVCADEPAATASGTLRTTAYFSTTGYGSSEELDELAHEASGEKGGDWVTNTTLLMYQGLEERAVFDALGQFAAVLATVIVLAAVSLIAGAFTISITERTRQFGLLSSLGASARQLRGTVLMEAAVLGAVGIPLGLVLGVAATAAVFSVTGEGWQAIVSTDTAVRLVVRPSDLALSAGLSALTVLASAFAPALRASRVSAVDAIRQARDVRPSRRLRRLFARRHGAMDGFTAYGRRPRGLAARLGGMPAFLARRTLAVSASKSRVAAVSLAVSVALLVTSGLVSNYLTGALDYVSYTGASDVRLYVEAEDAPEEGSADAGEDPATDAEDTEKDAYAAGLLALDSNAVAAEARRADGVAAASADTSVYVTAHLDPDGIDWADLQTFSTESPYAEYQIADDGYGPATIRLVDDETWRALASEIGLDEAYRDPAVLSCVVLNVADITTTEAYGRVTPFTGEAGELGIVLTPQLAGSQFFALEYGTYRLNTYDPEDYGLVSSTPIGNLGLEEVRVPVAAYATDLGPSFPVSIGEYAHSNTMTLVMPASAASATSELNALRGDPYYLSTTLYVSLVAGAREAEVIDELEAALDDMDGVEVLGSYNTAEEARQNRAIVFTVNVFLYGFAATTMAISVANVFNTIASGMMLRAREFAALRSAGMGPRAFRRMIVLECADFAAKGLLGGVALAALINVTLFRAMSLAFSTLVLEMPWGSVATAFAVVVGVLAVSVAYALRKTHALNIVEALRADAL